MCLGIPGRIVRIDDAENMLATVDVCGVRRLININCIVDDEHPRSLLQVPLGGAGATLASGLAASTAPR